MPAYVDKTKGTANYFQVFFVGISMVMAGHCAYWPGGLFQGFWEFFISTMIISLAFLCLCLCLSEMISILPFGGGAYGFSRVTMGPYIGFMVGFFDSISNIIYVALFNRAFVILFNFCFHIDYRYDDQPLMWFIVYVGIVVLQVLLGKFSFNFFTLMGIIVLAIPVVFVLGTTHLQNFHENVVVPQRLVKHELFPLGSKGFLRLLPISGLLYFGIDMLCLIAEDTKNAAVVVPRVMMVVYFVTFALAIALIFSVPSQYPGILAAPYNPLPMTFGFMDMFKTGFMKASITVLPSEIMEVYALTYAFGRQMCALSRSSLLPPMFSWTTSHNVPYMSLILGSVVGMLGLVVLLYADEKEFILRINLMYYVAQLCSITVYVVSMLSYLVFRFKYSVLERHFDVGWLGVPMAVLGIAIFAILFIMLSFFELDGYFLIKSYTILFAFGTVYYFGYARAHQSFSQEEQSILFAVYVIKANSRHRTVYRWLEKKYQRYVLKNVASASSKLRSSLRKSASKTRSKVTPAENTAEGNRLPLNSSESKLPGSEALVSIASDELYRSSLVSVTDGAGTGYEMLPQQSKESGMLVQLAPVTQLETAVYTDPNAVQKQESEDDLDQMMRDQIKYKQHASTKSETVSRRVMQTEFGDENVAATQSRRNSYSMTSP